MEGFVKFNCYWSQSGPVVTDEQYEIINHWREILFNLDLVGAFENGVGFGNISIRIGKTQQFVITGSSTEISPSWSRVTTSRCHHITSMTMPCVQRAAEGIVGVADACGDI